MSSYSSVRDLAARMRITPEALLERLREAGVDKSNAREPVYEADVKALSALYRKLLGPRAIEIAEEVRAEAVAAPEPARAQVNRVILVGNLGDDPETRYLPSGAAIASMRLLVADRYARLLREVLEGNVTAERHGHLLLELLQGRAPARLGRVYREQVRMHLRTSIANARYAHDRAAVGALTRSRRTVAAVCHRAERERPFIQPSPRRLWLSDGVRYDTAYPRTGRRCARPPTGREIGPRH